MSHCPTLAPLGKGARAPSPRRTGVPFRAQRSFTVLFIGSIFTRRPIRRNRQTELSNTPLDIPGGQRLQLEHLNRTQEAKAAAAACRIPLSEAMMDSALAVASGTGRRIALGNSQSIIVKLQSD